MMTDNRPSGNGWTEWKRKVLSDLETLSVRLDHTMEKITIICADIAVLPDLREDVKYLTKAVTELQQDVAVIKTRLATYGAISGAVTGLAVAIVTGLVMKAFGL